MRKINKNPEPKEWLEYRSTPGVDYQSIPALRRALLEEQGYICAYCMRRIPQRDYNSSEDSRIDHLLCREKHPHEKLSYSNMVICCPGAIDPHFHCDKRKDAQDITFNLFDQTFIDTLSYGTKDGEIKCSLPQYHREINEILNLNHPLLKKNRQYTLAGVLTQLGKKTWKVADIRKLIANWDTKDKEGKYKPYHAIVVWFLKKKLKQNASGKPVP